MNYEFKSYSYFSRVKMVLPAQPASLGVSFHVSDDEQRMGQSAAGEKTEKEQLSWEH